MNRMRAKFRRSVAALVCVVVFLNIGVSALAVSGPLRVWLPDGTGQNAYAAEMSTESDADVADDTMSVAEASASNAARATGSDWTALLQARIDALPATEEMEADETHVLLVDAYWEITEILDLLNSRTAVTTDLYEVILDEDTGFAEGGEELDLTKLWDVYEYVMASFAVLRVSEQIGERNFVTDPITVEPKGAEGDDATTLTLEITGSPLVYDSDDEDADGMHENAYFSYRTGEELELAYEISGGYPENYTYRIYIQPYDRTGVYDALLADGVLTKDIEEQVLFILDEEGKVSLGDYSASVEWDDSEEAYYVEFSGIEQKDTGGGVLPMRYLSPGSPGGDLLIYGVLYNREGTQVMSANTEAFDASWRTEREEFQVTLAPDPTQEESGLILEAGEDEPHVAVANHSGQPLLYTVSMETADDGSETADGMGADFVRSIEVTDTITLPAGITWTGVGAEDSPEIMKSDEKLYVTFGDSLTLVNESGMTAEDYSLVYDAGANVLTIGWTIRNASVDADGLPVSQIGNGVWEIRLNGDDLVLSDEAAFRAVDEPVVENKVRYEYSYCWSGTVSSEELVEIPIVESSDHVILTKTADREGEALYMGEDAYYTITLYNQGISPTRNLQELRDEALSCEQYIRPENIWNMFFADAVENTGDTLTLTITKATVYYDTRQEPDTVTDIEGNEGAVHRTNANMPLLASAYCAYDGSAPGATITMRKSEDGTGIDVTFSNGSEVFWEECVFSAVELKLLFLEMGYVVTDDATYGAVWDLSSRQLSGGESREYKVYSTFKDTFQYWENVYHQYAGSYQTANNTVTLSYDNGTKNEGEEGYQSDREATARYLNIERDFRIRKSIYAVGGKPVDTVDSLYKGSLVTYLITVQHDGEGVAEDLPLLDEASGSQILLAPASGTAGEKNAKSIAVGKWGFSSTVWERALRVNYEGTPYYLFYVTGTCQDVWLDDTHCASSVVVDASRYRDNSLYGSNLSYTITWNYSTFGGVDAYDNIDSLTYSMLISSNAYTTGAANAAYLNGLYERSDAGRVSGLYDRIAGTPIVSGSLQKRILTSDPEWDGDTGNECYAYASQIDLNSGNGYAQKVRYKLQMDTDSGCSSEVIFHSPIDVLPYTYGIFSWEKGVNVAVSQYLYGTEMTDAQGSPIAGPVTEPEYEIYYSDEDGNETGRSDGYLSDGKTPAYQSIRWMEDGVSQLTVPANAGGLWIYVELDFSLSASAWEAYSGEVTGDLENTFSARIDKNTERDQATVFHSVRTSSAAYLQKGVYWINTPNSVTKVGATDSREIYYNASEVYEEGKQTEGSRVAYYIQLYNASPSYLYLTEIQDLVPDGFTPLSLYRGSSAYQNGTGSAFGAGSATTVTNASDPVSYLDGAEDVVWKSAVVSASVSEDGRIRYTFSGGDLRADAETGYCYLARNEGISFLVEFAVETEKETDKYATNTIGMPCVQASSAEGVSVAGVYGYAVDALKLTSDADSESADQNVGGCVVIDETERSLAGFEAVTTSIGEVTQWLVSEVTVRRGVIIPGIQKMAGEDAAGGVNGTDSIEWTLKITNSGTVPMVNYIVADAMDSPFLLSGDVACEIYDAQGNPVLNMYSDEYPLFHIERDDDSSYTLTYYEHYYWFAMDYDVAGTVGESLSSAVRTTIRPAAFCVRDPADGELVLASSEIDVSIVSEDDGDLLSIFFADPLFAIPAGGTAVLTLHTMAPQDQTASSGIYYNMGAVLPTQSYEDAAVTIGEAVSAEDAPMGRAYVRSSDHVNVTNGYSTSAQKWVQSIVNPERIAGSEEGNSDGTSYIVLDDRDETFTYTLEVSNKLTSSMKHLLLVDTLPQSGDYAPFTTQSGKTARGSEFRVSLLEPDPGWKLEKGTKIRGMENSVQVAAGDTIENKTPITDYTVYYSTFTDFGKGMLTNAYLELDCVDDENQRIWTQDPAGARAVRIEIEEPIETGMTVQVSFHARISSDAEDEVLPGETGWNSFAYRYETGGTESAAGAGQAAAAAVNADEPAILWAAPKCVGVRVPDVPKLVKTLQGIEKEEAASMEDQTFRFLVHEGAALDDFAYGGSDTETLEQDLIAALAGDDPARAWFVTEITLSGETSAAASLADPDDLFSYVDGKTYTVVELPYESTKPGNSHFVSGNMEVDGNNVEANVISFVYSSTGPVTITVDNRAIEWENPTDYRLPKAGGVGAARVQLAGLALMAAVPCLGFSRSVPSRKRGEKR